MEYKLNDVQEKLLERHIIDIKGEVEKPMFGYVRTALTYMIAKGWPDITVTLTSDGGDGIAAFMIYELLRMYADKAQVTGQVVGYAHSAAAMILQACDKRIAHEHCQMRIHFGRDYYGQEEILDDAKYKALRDRLEKEIQPVLKLYDRCTLPPGELRAILLSNPLLGAEEALKYGFIDEIYKAKSKKRKE